MEGKGGPWTITKLAKVREYLIAYQDVMLQQKWAETIYIDAFCGSGAYKLRGARDFTTGSALQAIELERPFARYHFIEKSKASLDALRDNIDQRAHKRKAFYHAGDVNDMLPDIVASLTSKQRAVIFADPYGMQLHWKTVEAVAKVPRCDFWLLVPTMALLRVATKDPKRRQKSWDSRIDAFMGEQGWRTRWYESTGQTNFFDSSEEVIRTATLDKVSDDFRERLGQVFPAVAQKVLHLKDGNRPLFTLMFACSNPSPGAQRIAMRIANHLLRD